MTVVNQSFLLQSEFNEISLKKHEEKLDDLKFRFEENEELFEKMAMWMHVRKITLLSRKPVRT